MQRRFLGGRRTNHRDGSVSGRSGVCMIYWPRPLSAHVHEQKGTPMAQLNLAPDQLLSTTRTVRKRLDFSRPVPMELIRECLELAVQAPTGGNTQGWQWVVITDPAKRAAMGEIYRKGWTVYRSMTQEGQRLPRD